MFERMVAAMLALVMGGSSLGLAVCQLECRLELEARVADTAGAHQCHAPAQAPGNQASVRGAEACTHPDPADLQLSTQRGDPVNDRRPSFLVLQAEALVGRTDSTPLLRATAQSSLGPVHPTAPVPLRI